MNELYELNNNNFLTLSLFHTIKLLLPVDEINAWNNQNNQKIIIIMLLLIKTEKYFVEVIIIIKKNETDIMNCMWKKNQQINFKTRMQVDKVIIIFVFLLFLFPTRFTSPYFDSSFILFFCDQGNAKDNKRIMHSMWKLPHIFLMFHFQRILQWRQQKTQKDDDDDKHWRWWWWSWATEVNYLTWNWGGQNIFLLI